MLLGMVATLKINFGLRLEVGDWRLEIFFFLLFPRLPSQPFSKRQRFMFLFSKAQRFFIFM